MDLKDYFETRKGVGILSTADRDGKVDAAVYSRPHVMDDGSLAIIMRDRLTHANIQSNPHAVYLFVEEGPGFQGKRLFLTKIREEENSALIDSLRRRTFSPKEERRKKSEFLVFFEIEKMLPLIGAGE